MTMSTLIQYVRSTAGYMMISLAWSYCGSVAAKKKWNLRWYLVTLCFCIPIIIGTWLTNVSTTWMPHISNLFWFLYLVFACGLRRMELMKNFLLYIGLFMISDISGGMIMMCFWTESEMLSAKYGLTPLSYLMNGLPSGIFALLVAVTALFRRFHHDATWKERFWRIVRPVTMVLCLTGLYLSAMFRTAGMPFVERFNVILPDFILFALLSFLGSSYMVQDIKYLRQSRMNKALLYQKEAQDALLQDTRIFRHNIANLLYGLQGTILSHDQHAIEKYYQNLVLTCSLINNENVTALQRIPSLAVNSLLLNKIKAANGEKIPLYVFTDSDLVYRAPREKDMCEILGILLDNAEEGARKCSSPLITVEFHNTENSMELVVRNTFDESGLDPENHEQDILLSTKSQKTGHEGIGLQTIYQYVNSHSGTLFNLYVRGRYAEANLQFNE